MSAQLAAKGKDGGVFETRALKGLLVREGVETSTAQAACGLIPFGVRVCALKFGATAAGVDRVQIGDERSRAVLGWVSKKCLLEIDVPRTTATAASAAELIINVRSKCGRGNAANAIDRLHEKAAAVLKERGLAWLAPLLLKDGPQFVIKDGFLGRPAALRASAAARILATGKVPTTKTTDSDKRRNCGFEKVQRSVRGDKILYLRALESETDSQKLGIIEAQDNGGQKGGPRAVGKDYDEAVSNPLLAVMAAFAGLREALCAALEDVPADYAAGDTYAPTLINGISGLGEHEDLDLDNADDVQLARYMPGEMGYVCHRDTMDERTTFPPRLFSMIYFLNPDYREPDAGKLKLYLGRAAVDLEGSHKVTAPLSCPFVEIGPTSDRIVIFRSSSFHEVLPTNEPRLAITQWIAGRPPKKMGEAN